MHVVHLGGLQLISLFYNKILIFIATRGGVSGNPGGRGDGADGGVKK